MTQNVSSAVMQQRREPDDSLDYFPTPPWAARALCAHVLLPMGFALGRSTCWEPACGEGHLARGLLDYFPEVWLSDVHPYDQVREAGQLVDFIGLERASSRFGEEPPDWIITNPPFRLGAEFIGRALIEARIGVAMFVRTAFTEGKDRYRDIFAPTAAPPTLHCPFAERVTIFKGRCLNPDLKYILPGHDKPVRPASATAYCWLVWSKLSHHASGLTVTKWIPPCRRALQRDDDYDPVDEEVAA